MKHPYASKAKIAAILLVIVLLPAYALCEASTAESESAYQYERLELLRLNGLTKDIDTVNPSVPTALREAISEAVILLPSPMMDANGGYTFLTYEVVDVRQIDSGTVVALNLFCITYLREQEKLLLKRYEAEPWLLTFDHPASDGSYHLACIQDPWDVDAGLGYEYALDTYWIGNFNSYPGLAMNEWLKIDASAKAFMEGADPPDHMLMIRQYTVSDTLLHAINTYPFPSRLRPTWPHAAYNANQDEDVLCELSLADNGVYTVSIKSVTGEQIDTAVFYLDDDDRLVLTTEFSAISNMTE